MINFYLRLQFIKVAVKESKIYANSLVTKNKYIHNHQIFLKNDLI